ncbi:MAG: hypothetical protein R3B82_24845 [Sandaracinaceae bacterium]
MLARYFRAPTQAGTGRSSTPLVDDGIEAVLAHDHARARKLFQAAAAIDPEHPRRPHQPPAAPAQLAQVDRRTVGSLRSRPS